MTPDPEPIELSDLPNIKDEHIAILKELGIETMSDLREALWDESRAREVMDHLPGIGPRTMERWKEMVTKATVAEAIETASEEVSPPAEEEPDPTPEEVPEETLEVVEVEVIISEPEAGQVAEEPAEAESIQPPPTEQPAWDTDRKRLILTIQNLLAINSSKVKGKRGIIKYASQRLRDCGLKVYEFDSGESPFVIGTKGEKGLVIAGHLDNHPLEKMKKRNQGRLVWDAIYGTGIADVKGGCAAALCAVEKLSTEEQPFSVFFTTDDLTEGTGVDELRNHRITKEAKGILVLKPTDFTPVYGEMGQLDLSLVTNGERSVANMLVAIALLEELRARNDGDGLTLTVSYIRAGKRKKLDANPLYCEAHIRFTFPPPRTTLEVKSMVESELLAAQPGGMVLVGDIDKKEPLSFDPSSDLVQALVELTGRESKVVPKLKGVPDFGEAVPNICLWGPGRPEDINLENESLAVDDMMRTYLLMMELVRRSKDWM